MIAAMDPLEDLDDDVDDFVTAPRMIEREWDDLTWQDQAACTDADTELFFGPVQERGDKREAREAYVIDSLCSVCMVRRSCRDFGRRHREFGVWGGETEQQRARAGFAPDLATGREIQRLSQLAKLERDGMIAR